MSWWKHGVIYQIYPRSFLDTNGDGTGDLEGIRRKLDYLQELGVSGIWLSPINPSPMFDFGYDVSNYRDIDPVFGNLDLFKILVKEAEHRNIRIIMDMVLNHSSHLHPWFEESRKDRNNSKAGWYIWQDAKPGILGRKRPNNWMAAFGGHAWQWDENRKQYYLHLFTVQQPDLNWRNPELKKAVFRDLSFWLDLGVKGFRLDVINYLIKDNRFRNNPYRWRFTYPRRHDLQHHRYDRNQDECFDIIRELRSLTDAYPDTMMVGEVYPDEGVHAPDLAGRFMGNDLLHMAFDFSPMYTPFKAETFRGILRDWYSTIPPGGWPCHVFSNHDQSRASSRLAGKYHREEKLRLLAMLLLTQRGTPFMYYGEEIGMTDVKLKPSELRDPVGKKYYPFHPGRDRSRTPMQWDNSINAGFSEAKPWLRVGPDYRQCNAEKQMKDNNSLFHWYKKLIALRSREPAFHKGTIEFPPVHEQDLLYYIRKDGDKQFGVILNISPRPVSAFVSSPGKVCISTHREAGSSTGRDLYLSPYEGTIVEWR